ncbi:MAG: NfeD family protein [Bacillota bacterium]
MGNFKQVFSVFIFLILFLFSLTILSSAEGDIYRIPVEGEIDSGMVSFIRRGIKEAETEEAEHIIFAINTYGGLVDSSNQIKDLILNTPLPTTTFVVRRAFSGGALVALGGQNLVMNEGSSIGAAETIPEKEKYISALRTEFRSTAEQRGRDGDIAAAMVDADLEVSDLVERGKILSLTAKKAGELNFADHVVSDIDELLAILGLSENQIVEIKPSAPERLARFVTNPGISAFLLTIGFLAFFVEMLIPGWGIGGTTGVLSLGLFFTGHMIHGYASWGLLALMFVGIFLLLLEVFVVPGFGVTGIGGLGAIFASVYFVFPSGETALTVIAIALVGTVFGVIILLKFFGSSRFWKKLSMDYSESTEQGYTTSENKSRLMGSRGLTITPLRPSGIVEIDNERIDVVTEGGMIDKGEKVEVVKVAGRRIVVKKINEESD